MEIMVISYPDYFNGEIDLIHNMFDEGLAVFHLRKPEYNENQLTEFLDRIKPEFHSRIKVHSTFLGFFNRFGLGGIHIPGAMTVNSNIINLKKDKKISISSSFHSFDEAIRDNEYFDYAFLSPVFDSISKKNYKSGFDFNELSKVIAQANIRLVALGGCKAENLNKVRKLGFSGAAVLGAVWNSNDPLESYIGIKEAAAGL